MDNTDISITSKNIKKIIEIIRASNFQDQYENSSNIYGERFSLIISICEIVGEQDLAKAIKKYEFPLYNEYHNILKFQESTKKIYQDISEIINNKLIETDSNKNDKKDIIKYCLDCIASTYSIVTMPSNLTSEKNNLLTTIKEYWKKIDDKSLRDLKKRIVGESNYTSDKITEIGKTIINPKFLKEANEEFLFSLYKNPFLLMVPICEILKEEEVEKEIVETINETLRILNINTNYNREIKPELLDRNTLIEVSEVISNLINTAKFNNKENDKILTGFLKGIELHYAHKNFSNNQNQKKLSTLNKESQIAKIFNSFDYNLQNSDFIKEIEEKNVALLLEEENNNPKQPKEKNKVKNKKTKDSFLEKKEDYLPNQNNKTLTKTTKDDDLLIPISKKNNQLETKKNKKEKSKQTKESKNDDTEKSLNSVTIQTTSTNSNSNYNKAAEEKENIILPKKDSEIKVTKNIISTTNDKDDYKIDYQILEGFLGNKNFPKKPNTSPSNTTSNSLLKRFSNKDIIK